MGRWRDGGDLGPVRVRKCPGDASSCHRNTWHDVVTNRINISQAFQKVIVDWTQHTRTTNFFITTHVSQASKPSSTDRASHWWSGTYLQLVPRLACRCSVCLVFSCHCGHDEFCKSCSSGSFVYFSRLSHSNCSFSARSPLPLLNPGRSGRSGRQGFKD